MKNRKSIPIIAGIVIALASLACGSTATPVALDVSGIQTAAVETALAAAQAPLTAGGSTPARVPPTLLSPVSTETSSPDATPLTLSGRGDSVQDVSSWPQIPGLAVVEGNANGRYFGIISYAQNGNRLSALVNTTDPYKGICPFGFDGEYPARLEVKATDAWTIQIVPLSQARQLLVPGTIQGTGDEVIVLAGAIPDMATVTGNSDSRYFGVIAYDVSGSRLGAIVNTTEPYQGTAIVKRNTSILEIKAPGNWSIEVAATP